PSPVPPTCRGRADGFRNARQGRFSPADNTVEAAGSPSPRGAQKGASSDRTAVVGRPNATKLPQTRRCPHIPSQDSYVGCGGIPASASLQAKVARGLL